MDSGCYIDEEDNRNQRSLKVQDLIPNNLGFRVVTQWNGRSQLVGNSGGLLAGFLGFTANNFDTFPILYKRWPKVPEEYKDNVYKDIKFLVFVITTGSRFRWLAEIVGEDDAM